MLVGGDLAEADDGDPDRASPLHARRHRRAPWPAYRRPTGRACRARRRARSPVAPASSHGRMLSGLIPPTASTGTSLGNDRQLRLEHAGRRALGREQLERVRAGADRGERLGRREVAGTGDQAGRGRWREITSILVSGETMIRPPASRTRPTSSASSTVPAPTSARSPNFAASRSMLVKRVGRIQRHLDDPDAAFEDRVADRFGLVGRDAADDRDQRALVEIAVEQLAWRSRQILFAIS